MACYNPPHEVRDQDKLQSMISALESGRSLPPILVYGVNAYCGSHRIAAYEYCNMEPDVVEIDGNQYCAIMDKLGLNPNDLIYDYDDFMSWADDLGFIGNAEK